MDCGFMASLSPSPMLRCFATVVGGTTSGGSRVLPTRSSSETRTREQIVAAYGTLPWRGPVSSVLLRCRSSRTTTQNNPF